MVLNMYIYIPTQIHIYIYLYSYCDLVFCYYLYASEYCKLQNLNICLYVNSSYSFNLSSPYRSMVETITCMFAYMYIHKMYTFTRSMIYTSITMNQLLTLYTFILMYIHPYIHLHTHVFCYIHLSRMFRTFLV